MFVYKELSIYILAILVLSGCSIIPVKQKKLSVYDLSYKAESIEVDTDDNGAIDIAYGGTNSQTVSAARTALGVPASTVVPELHTDTTDPTVDDDTDNYKVGDVWLNTTDDHIWVLIDATDGAAIWQLFGRPQITNNGSISSNTSFVANQCHTLTVGGDFTLSVTWDDFSGYQWIELVITGNASNSITWPTANWSFNTEPTQPFAAKYQIIQFVTYNGGSTVFGFEIGTDME